MTRRCDAVSHPNVNNSHSVIKHCESKAELVTQAEHGWANKVELRLEQCAPVKLMS